MKKFKLQTRPRAFQLSIHLNNILDCQRWESEIALNIIKDYLTEPESINNIATIGIAFRIKQMVDYYGLKYCRSWFKEFYKWEYKKAG